jgi:hypothetical protein
MAGKKYSDIFKTANTASVADTDLFAVERADGNTYVLIANTIYNYVANKVTSTRAVNFVTTDTFNANLSSDIILCDPNTADEDITVTLPAGANNKIFTIKCITPGAYSVIVTTSNTSVTQIEAAVGGSIGNTTSLTSIGEVYTWVAFDGVYRKIGGP